MQTLIKGPTCINQDKDTLYCAQFRQNSAFEGGCLLHVFQGSVYSLASRYHVVLYCNSLVFFSFFFIETAINIMDKAWNVLPPFLFRAIWVEIGARFVLRKIHTSSRTRVVGDDRCAIALGCACVYGLLGCIHHVRPSQQRHFRTPIVLRRGKSTMKEKQQVLEKRMEASTSNGTVMRHMFENVS